MGEDDDPEGSADDDALIPDEELSDPRPWVWSPARGFVRLNPS
jgi:hypothetical protein